MIGPKESGKGMEEMRIDKTDGQAYSKQEFMECYGGTKEWQAAPIHVPPQHNAATAVQQQQKPAHHNDTDAAHPIPPDLNPRAKHPRTMHKSHYSA